jgi:uncharacterized membrane protein
LRTAGLALAVLGIAVAGYLVYVHYADVEPVCNIAHGCHKVQTSKYADLAGVPVALLGLIGYVVIFLALLVRGEAARMLAALTALVGFGFSAYLTYRELFTIDAICQWCVASAILMTGLAVVCTWRLLADVNTV